MHDAKKYPEILQDLKGHVLVNAKAEGVTNETAEKIAHCVAEAIRKSWGGMVTYIPKGREYKISGRDIEIWRKFTGHNHHALCTEYDISVQWLYQIIACQRRAEMLERQGDLFE